MRLVSFQRSGRPVEPGVVVDSKVIGLAPAGYPDMLSVIAGGSAALEKIAAFIRTASVGPLSAVTLTAPIPRPPKLICVGLNHRDHAGEPGMKIPKLPTILNKCNRKSTRLTSSHVR